MGIKALTLIQSYLKDRYMYIKAADDNMFNYTFIDIKL